MSDGLRCGLFRYGWDFFGGRGKQGNVTLRKDCVKERHGGRVLIGRFYVMFRYGRLGGLGRLVAFYGSVRYVRCVSVGCDRLWYVFVVSDKVRFVAYGLVALCQTAWVLLGQTYGRERFGMIRYGLIISIHYDIIFELTTGNKGGTLCPLLKLKQHKSMLGKVISYYTKRAYIN